MKRSTLWIIGITTAVITAISLKAAVGHKYYERHGAATHHPCWHDKKTGDGAATGQQGDPMPKR